MTDMRNNNPHNRIMIGRGCGWFANVFVWLLMANFVVSFFASDAPGAGLVAPPAKDEVEITLKRTGKVSDSALLSKRPSSGAVTDLPTWKSLWSAWRGDEEIPEVDFESQIVLVATIDGPNLVSTSSLNLTPSGDLRYESGSGSSRSGPGFGYAFLIVPGNGVLSVNGQIIGEQIIGRRELGGQQFAEQKFAGQELNSQQLAPSAPTTMPSTQPRIPSATMAGAVDDESIWVEIQGRVRTGEMSRGKSTGTMVVADGIVWELDLRDDAQLIQAANQLGTDVGTIKGTLSRLRNPNRSNRWIVDVESIEPGLASKRMDRSAELAQSQPSRIPTAPLSSERSFIDPLPVDETRTIPVHGGNAKRGDNGMQMNKTASQQTGFRSIVISATGGQSSLERKQIVAADGSVTLEVPRTYYSESFSLSENSLQELHQFVASTDWRSVPRSTASADKSVATFSISIETRSGTKRFFTDEASVGSQPVISKLFSLMQKPKNAP